MDKCYAKVNSWPSIGRYCPGEGPRMNKLMQDTTNSCNRYGAYTVRKAAIEQMAEFKKMNWDSEWLTHIGLEAYSYNLGDLIHISNVAFDYMTDEEKHIEFCLNHNVQPFLFNK